MPDQAGVPRYPGRFSALQYRQRRQYRYNCPGSMTTCRRSLATLAALVSGVALIFAQPVDMAGRIRAEGQQRSRALALFRTLTDDIARD